MLERLEEIKSYKNYYRNNYRRLLLALMMSLIVIIALIVIIIYVVFKQIEPQYYATSSSGELTSLKPGPRGVGLSDSY